AIWTWRLVLYRRGGPDPAAVRWRRPAGPIRAAAGPAGAVPSSLPQNRAFFVLPCGASADRPPANDPAGKPSRERGEVVAPSLHAVGTTDEFRNRQHGDVAPGRADAVHGGGSAGSGAAGAPLGNREPLPGARRRLAADRAGTGGTGGIGRIGW